MIDFCFSFSTSLRCLGLCAAGTTSVLSSFQGSSDSLNFKKNTFWAFATCTAADMDCVIKSMVRWSLEILRTS